MTKSPSSERLGFASDLGSVIRRLRTQRGLTVAALAQAVGKAPSYISQVERGVVIPSIPALHQLAEALGVPTFYFFVQDESFDLVVRAGQRRVMEVSEAARYELASPTLRRNMQLIQCYLAPGKATASEPFAHKGEEAVYVLEGTVELTVGSQKFILEPGDAAQFEAALPHCYRNLGDQPAVLLFCISPPM